MKKTAIVMMSLLSLAGCKQKNKVDDLAFKFCDKVTNNKSEYLKCFTDIVECHAKSSDQFDNEIKFIECARLFRVNEPTSQPFKYLPSINETDLDEEVWREIENLDKVDRTRKKKEEKNEPLDFGSDKPEAAPKPVVRAPPKIEYRTLPAPKPKPKPAEPKVEPTRTPEDPSKGIAKELPKEVKWKLDKLKRESEEAKALEQSKAAEPKEVPAEPAPAPEPETPKPEPKEEFDF